MLALDDKKKALLLEFIVLSDLFYDIDNVFFYFIFFIIFYNIQISYHSLLNM